MDGDETRERMHTWDALPGNLAEPSYLGYPHPLDAKLDALCALYLDAAPANRRQLAALALPEIASREASVVANNLLTYIRRCGRRIRQDDIGPMRLAMAAAALSAERVDERDLALALVFLRAGATRAAISTAQALRLLGEMLAEPAGGSDVPRGELIARRVISGVWRSDEQAITRILAYHVGTG